MDPLVIVAKLQKIIQNLNDKASFYIENRPDLSASKQKIRLLEQQVSELVQHYKNIITDEASETL